VALLPRQVPWPRIVAEGIAIIVSILLAFAIQAWWEGRQLRAVEGEILAGLASDFRANQEQLRFITRLLDGIQRPLADLEDLAPERLDQVTDGEFGMALQGTPTFDSRDATLDATISSGNLGTIRDSHLRDLLAEWKSQIEDLSEEATAFREASARAVDRIGILGGPWVDDPNTHLFAIGPASVEALERFEPFDLGAVASDPEVLAHLRVKRMRGLSYQRFLMPLEALADSILVQIERASAN
jgi:hypothetical protein